MNIPTRVYLETVPGSRLRFLEIHNYNPNDIDVVMGLFGLSGNKPILSMIFPDQVLNEAEIEPNTYTTPIRWREATKVEKRADHITCHADGQFWIKTTDKHDLYIQKVKQVEPCGPDTPVFLNFQVISDVAKKYAPETEQGRYHSAWFSVEPEEVIHLNGMFSGINYPLEKEAAATMLQQTGYALTAQPVVYWSGGTLKGMLWGFTQSVTPEVLSKKPAGTIVAFKLNNPSGQTLFKTFVFR